MTNYKGFNIPDTVADCVAQAATSPGMAIPQVQARNPENGMRIILPIPIEEVVNQPEQLIQVVKVCKECIDVCLKDCVSGGAAVEN